MQCKFCVNEKIPVELSLTEEEYYYIINKRFLCPCCGYPTLDEKKLNNNKIK